MDDSSEGNQLLAEIRDLLQKADDRQSKQAKSIQTMMKFVYGTMALCLVLAGLIMWLMYVVMTPVP